MADEPPFRGTPRIPTVGDLVGLLERAKKEPDFRSNLLSDPKTTLNNLGYIFHAERCAVFLTLKADDFDTSPASWTSRRLDPSDGMGEL